MGKANLGDEALYDAFVSLFPDSRLISTYDPLPLELSLHSLLIRGTSLFNGVMLGGGTLIFHKGYIKYLRKAQDKGVPTAVFGTGVIDAEFWSERLGDLGYEPRKDEWRQVLVNADYIGVRGPDSAALLDELGIHDHEVIGDPALSICPAIDEKPRGRSRRIAFNTGNIGPAWGTQSQIEKGLGESARRLADNGWGVDFFGMHAVDASRARALVNENELAKSNIWSECHNTGVFLEQLARYDIVVSQKLHGVVLSAGLGIPCVSIAYEPKCVDFMKSVGLEGFIIRADKLEPVLLEDKVRQIDNEYEQIRERIRERVNHWRMKQREAASRVGLLFEKGSVSG